MLSPSILKTAVAGSSGMLVPIYQTTRHHIKEDGNLIRHSENVRFQVDRIYWEIICLLHDVKLD
jgi:hypothetical protein